MMLRLWFCFWSLAFLFAGAAFANAAEIAVDRDAKTTFMPTGEVKSEGRSVRIFIVKRGGDAGAIEGFNPAGGDRLRIEGFGLTDPEAVKALMRQENRDIVLALPGGPSLKILNTAIESLSSASFQLELDRRGLVQTFADDFDAFSWYAEGLSPEKDGHGTWRTHYGWQAPGQEGSRSFPGESEIYADAAFKGTSPAFLGLNPFHISNGTLEIRGEPAPESALPFIWGRRYVSGAITTKFSFSQLYGVFEIRARLPKGRGFWPAFWLLPVDGSWPPEIDVLEVLGHETAKLYLAAHTNAGGEHTASGGDALVPDLSADFHVFTVEWRNDWIRWYLDGVEVKRAATPPDMHKPMYLLANLAIGASWPGQPDASTRFPGVYAIDWIRAYRRAAQGD
jgi:hypothetical protein